MKHDTFLPILLDSFPDKTLELFGLVFRLASRSCVSHLKKIFPFCFGLLSCPRLFLKTNGLGLRREDCHTDDTHTCLLEFLQQKACTPTGERGYEDLTLVAVVLRIRLCLKKLCTPNNLHPILFGALTLQRAALSLSPCLQLKPLYANESTL